VLEARVEPVLAPVWFGPSDGGLSWPPQPYGSISTMSDTANRAGQSLAAFAARFLERPRHPLPKLPFDMLTFPNPAQDPLPLQ
jgi:hypothetical protein